MANDQSALEAKVAQLQTELSNALEAKRKIEQSIPLEHVHSHRMANEVLGRLQTARINVGAAVLPASCGTKQELIAQIDSIVNAIQLGNQLHANGCMMCW